ncbi:LexA family transcriptional regulator [Comamonadaceae bacterium OTU4NAUVB1]|nr:LexA family transcriptional regulator [Comamonadaceae bacterium OTU4NAUVB1]
MKSIGEQAKEFRLAKGWNYIEMAKEVSRYHRTTVSRQLITQLEEKGDRRPQYLSALARTMGTTVEVLDQGLFSVADKGIVSDHIVLNEALTTGQTYSESTQDREVVHIPQYEAGGAMGQNLILQGDQPGIIRHMAVTQEWAQKNLKAHTGLQNLCIVTGFGDSMKPMYNPGDPLILDKGITTCEVDAVYFFRVDGHGFIKRLQIIPGEGIRVISVNKDYEPWTIKRDSDFEVFGRVMKAWRGEDL